MPWRAQPADSTKFPNVQRGMATIPNTLLVRCRGGMYHGAHKRDWRRLKAIHRASTIMAYASQAALLPSAVVSAMNDSSNELVTRWRQGEEDAATELYRRYINRLLRAVDSHLPPSLKAKVEADDVCQSVFRSIFRRIRRGEFTFAEDADVWRLLVTVAFNKLRNKMRFAAAGKRDTRRELSYDVGGADMFVVNRLSQGPSLEETIEFEELMNVIGSQLSPREQELLALRLEGYDQKEIADKFGVSTRTIRRMNDELRERILAVVSSQ